MQRLRDWGWACGFALALSACGGGALDSGSVANPAPAPAPASTVVVPYGAAPQQFGYLGLPPGAGPHPLVLVIHGGCWQRSIASAGFMNDFSGALRDAGWAVWNIEYRLPGDADYRWPDTFTDIAAALDFTPTLASRYPLDLSRLTVVGHSAGGHLALWAASRNRLTSDSPLYSATPQLPQRALGLAAITDLQRYPGEGRGCASAIPRLLGEQEPSESRLVQTSPLLMLPAAAQVSLITASGDAIVPAAQAQRYRDAAEAAGASVTVSTVAGDHFTTIATSGSAFEAVLAALRKP
ncbi:alpha/beta hydrolase [Niveibacterium sp. 24ML]|uniref:alpha/beta hydrolase family protein n=1 Tax=Niveibacterium sp. 24ML TaxID=2985512 RepID=UPI00226DFB87|nr:alpha/beta hydrolase [Niveibacterium sp. 24ML]MCX9158000.1 alpha/beta hydrolase [Niveibacterium sp. 24ML]